MTVPPARQCTLPGCEREAVDPENPGALCRFHLDSVEGGEPVSEPDESGGSDGSAPSSQEPDTSLTVESDVYPQSLVDVEQWHAWKETDDGRKVPRAPYEHRTHPERFVSAQDPAVWRDFATVQEWCEKLPGYGPAFNIRDRDEHSDEDLVLVDYDDARDPETGAVHPTVREHIERAESYADVSTSGTGVHILCRGTLPDGVKAIEAHLPTAEGFPDAEIEVYDSGRFVAMTGAHFTGTPAATTRCQAFIDDLTDEFATVAKGKPDEMLHEPETSKAELADVDTTGDIQDVLDAIQHVEPRDIRLRSTVTQERSDGSKSLDPSWAQSESGTRLAQVGDGWVYRKGMVGLDALQVVALEERIITDVREYPDGEDFWEAVDALRDRGAHIPEYEGGDDVDHTAVLPPAVRDLSTATSGWDWTQHSRTVDSDLSMDRARERCLAAIEDAYERADQVLVEALPTLGKSYGTIAAAASTGEQIAAFTGRGRKEQYEQLAEWCEEHGLTYNVLPSFLELCDTATGEFGAEAAERVRDWYRRGATPQEIHKHGDVPCQAQEGHECPYTSAWRSAYEDPDGEPYDVLIGHYNHAHNDEVVQGRTVVFDEFPGSAYETTLDHLLAPAVSYFLQAHDALPFDDYADLLEHRDDEQRRADALAWFQERDLGADETLVFEDSQVHAAAPVATFTILASPGDDLGNGWERADLGDDGVGLFDREAGRVHLLQPPALEYTSGVVALDGTPTKRMWELAVGARFSSHRQVLTDAERQEYLRDVLNLQLVRTTDAMKPYNSADHVAVDQDAALLEAIRDEHEQRPSVITTTTAEHEYDEADVLEDLVDESKHYGNVFGSNEFDDTRLGAVIGSNHYGDRYIEKWGAFYGVAVERGDEKGADLSYGRFGDRVLTHMREHETLQAAMRFGRDGNGAVVYVHTGALPDWVPLAGEGRVLSTWSDGMRQVLAAIEDLDEWSTAEVADHPAVEIGVRQVRDHLTTLVEEHDVVEREADGCGFVWREDGLHRLGEHGDVELEPIDLDDLSDEESAELARSSTYTWDFRTSATTSGPNPSSSENVVNSPGSPAATGGDPPPDPPD